MNIQKPTKQSLLENGFLYVNEIFPTIQGEGPFSGRPAIFIRLSGCNLQCSWCDTEYTNGEAMTDLDILMVVKKLCPNNLDGMLVVISGGEPFRQNISQLCKALLKLKYVVQIETNGTLSNPDFPWDNVHVVVSPKTKFLHKDVKKNHCYYKYVVSSDDSESEDGLPLFETQNSGGGIPAPPSPSTEMDRIYLSPLDSHDVAQNFENRKTAIDLCMKFGYNLSLQIHKYLNLP